MSEDEQWNAERLKMAWPRLLHQHDTKRCIADCQVAGELFQVLLKRAAIPQIRLDYFNKPELNSSNTKASRLELFKRNAGDLEAVISHQHFWPYLLYFIYGPDLPTPIQEKFSAVAGEYFRDYNATAKLARKQFRELCGDRKDRSESFFQLALECGCPTHEADAIRRAILAIR